MGTQQRRDHGDQGIRGSTAAMETVPAGAISNSTILERIHGARIECNLQKRMAIVGGMFRGRFTDLQLERGKLQTATKTDNNVITEAQPQGIRNSVTS